jgi:hypothetical protein
LIEHVIRPDCLIDPSNAGIREDQRVEMNHLKQLLREHLEEGLPQIYVGSKPSCQIFLPPLLSLIFSVTRPTQRSLRDIKHPARRRPSYKVMIMQPF